MSPTIFRDKWLSKFRDLLEYPDTCAEERARSHPLEWLCHIFRYQLLHITTFNSDAQQLYLIRYDFPPDPEYRGYGEHWLKGRADATVFQANPFVVTDRVFTTVDIQLYRLEKCKHGMKFRGAAWQRLPLWMRQDINGHIYEIAKSREEGWWPITEAQREELWNAIWRDGRGRDFFLSSLRIVGDRGYLTEGKTGVCYYLAMLPVCKLIDCETKLGS